MIALLQRVVEAKVVVDGQCVGAIGPGLAVLVGVRPADSTADAERLLQRLLHYRIFDDARDRMNRSLIDIHGGLLLVPQFTLAADTRKGLRPGFSHAAPPEQGRRLFDDLLERARNAHSPVASGVFGAHMQLSLTNDGPATFWLETSVQTIG